MSAPEIDLKPTLVRQKLCRDIEAGKVRWYRWIDKHWACNTAAGDRAVTADVKLLEHHGIAEILPLPDPRDLYSLVRLTDTGRVWAGIVKPIYYEYRILVDGEYEQFLRLRDVEERAESLFNGGVQTRIEIRQIKPVVTDWAPLAWEDTRTGRLGYEPFPGYRDKCIRCKTFDSTGSCCSSHDKQLCHACYRRTHFVEVCDEGCPRCLVEGLPVLLSHPAEGGEPKATFKESSDLGGDAT